MKSVKDIFLQYEKIGYFSRINEDVWPTAFKCATVSTDELHILRKVKNIVRRGRIESLEHDKIIFKDKRFANHSTNYYTLLIHFHIVIHRVNKHSNFGGVHKDTNKSTA